MKRVLFLDRGYSFLYAKETSYERIYVALTKHNRIVLEARGLKVVGCFEEQFNSIPLAPIPENYLLFSQGLDRFLTGQYSYKQRQEILSKEISFWQTILDEWKPDLVLNEVCTMEWVEVLYIEASKRDIPYRAFLVGSSSSKFYWLDSPFNSEISPEIWANVIPSDQNYKDAEAYVEGIIQKQLRPFYVMGKKSSKLRSILGWTRYYFMNVFKHISYAGNFQYEDYRESSRIMLEAIVRSVYISYDRIPSDDTEFIFFPIHYEPEATISYFAEFYSNQVYDIESIAKCIKSNQLLVVKEHPQQCGMLLTKKFQELKKRCPNVLFISGEESVVDVMNKCKCIVTITGTAGYECMMIGKPVFTLGKVFYNACSECTHITNWDQLKDAIRNNRYLYPDRQKVVNFVAKFMAIQKQGCAYIINNKIDEEGTEQFMKAIEDIM